MNRTELRNSLNRREWLAAAAAAGWAARPGVAAASAAKVALSRCPSYGSGVLPVVRQMFDSLGGVAGLVKGKTVAIKINMSNPLRDRTGYRPSWFTRWTHPSVIAAAVTLFGEAGATRIRVLEGSTEDAHPLEENFLIGGWDPATILSAAKNVEMENTSSLGTGKEYLRVDVPKGGLVYPGFDLNHCYVECDVFVSIAKLLEDPVTGISLTMKNMIGATPVTIYGDAAGFEEPAEQPYGERTILSKGHRQPSATAPAENDPASPRDAGYRLPRITVDLVAARPIHIAIIDGIETQTATGATVLDPGSHRQIRQVKPGVLVAGFNPVAVDAVGAAVMGFDPLAPKGKAPFENCDNMLQLAAEAGLGVCDLGKIEIAGAPLKTVQLAFRSPA
jgi:uncharacterized protein (DUF362 family)